MSCDVLYMVSYRLYGISNGNTIAEIENIDILSLVSTTSTENCHQSVFGTRGLSPQQPTAVIKATPYKKPLE